jgi:hypothetical protein
LFNPYLVPLLEVLLAKFISPIGHTYLLFLEQLELIQDFFHILYPRLVFVVVTEHLEDDFTKGKAILKGLEYLELRGIPDADDICIDCPYYIIEEIA